MAVSENTSVMFDCSTRTVAVMGEAFVHLVDVTKVGLIPGEYWGLRSNAYHHLTRYDSMDMITGEINFASWKAGVTEVKKRLALRLGGHLWRRRRLEGRTRPQLPPDDEVFHRPREVNSGICRHHELPELPWLGGAHLQGGGF